MEDEDNPLFESPLDFMTPTEHSEGFFCDGQAVLPEGNEFRVICTCDEWSADVRTTEEGLELARRHTGSISP